VPEPTITLNGEPFPWREGLTIADIIADKGWKYPLLITKIDDRVVRPAEFPRAVVPAGAIVLIHHLMSGG